ncbi:MAG: 4Fe-4S dicluster domain-containing protein, partial [Candidatus Aenigmatarchaeota archaeon]
VGNCILCKTCVENCPEGAMKLNEKEKRPQPSSGCLGCSNCILVCPQKALKPKVATFDFLLAEAAKAAISKFKKVYFVNFLQRMAKLCDCYNQPLEPVISDIGILASSDILAIEKATYDLILEKEGRDVFKELNKKSFLEQLKAAEELKMGSKEFELERI